MSKLPNESDFPRYDSTEYWPLCAKFLFYGADKGAAREKGSGLSNFGWNISI